MFESFAITTAGTANEGSNIIAIEPGESEKTIIEDFSSIPLEDLQDHFGTYQETLSKY